jgi:hypothetical protein
MGKPSLLQRERFTLVDFYKRLQLLKSYSHGC